MKRDTLTLLLLAAVVVGSIFLLRDRGVLGEDQVGIALTITYTDGSTRTVDPFESVPLWTNKLMVTDETGNEVKSVDWAVKIRVTWRGEKTGHTVTGEVSVSVNGYQRATSALSSPATLENGVLAKVGTGSISASDLQSWGKTSEQNTLTVTADVYVKLAFQGTDVDSRHGEGSATFKYNVMPAGEISAINVVVSLTPIV